MMKSSIVSKILDFFFPPKCEVCGDVSTTKDSLCEDCLNKYSSEKMKRCPLCGKTAPNCNCKTAASDHNHICGTFYTHYENDSARVTEKMIFVLKRRKKSRLQEFFGRETAASVMKFIKANGLETDECVITFPPRSERSLLDYGFDHAERVSERVSYYTGIPLTRTLIREGGVEQKSLDARSRFANARDTLKLAENVDLTGKVVFLFDDVFTTGATLVTAAELLRHTGAEDIVLVTIAKTMFRKEGK